jgi:polyferredoxin
MATQVEGATIPPALQLPDAVRAKLSSGKPREKLVRRLGKDHSQALRRTFQVLFLVTNVWLGSLFYRWVRYFETGPQIASVERPAGVEGWLPIAGMMNFKYWLVTRHVPSLHPAAMFLLITFLSISFLFRKAFCSWLCPVGTISEYLWRLGQRVFRRNFPLPRWLDLPLRGLKYLLLGFFVWAVYRMSAEAIELFMRSPYGLIADVKMLNFFRFLGQTGLIVIGLLVLLSIVIKNFWCRYLCPYGALLGLTSLASPLRVRRSPAACIDCSKCAQACPSNLAVDQLVTIKSAECTGCLECVAACPAQNALQLSLPEMVKFPRNGRIPAWAVAAGIAALFFGIIGYAKASGAWTTNVPAQVYQQLVPHANEARHPMPGDPELR